MRAIEFYLISTNCSVRMEALRVWFMTVIFRFMVVLFRFITVIFKSMAVIFRVMAVIFRVMAVIFRVMAVVFKKIWNENSGHLVPQPRQRAAHALRLEQNNQKNIGHFTPQPRQRSAHAFPWTKIFV